MLLKTYLAAPFVGRRRFKRDIVLELFWTIGEPLKYETQNTETVNYELLTSGLGSRSRMFGPLKPFIALSGASFELQKCEIKRNFLKNFACFSFF